MSSNAFVPFRGEVLVDSSADESTGIAIDVNGATNITFYVTGTGTTSSGVITFEEATTQTYAGTWSVIGTANASDVTGGQQQAVHVSQRSYAWVRPRISTVIGGGGTVSVILVAV